MAKTNPPEYRAFRRAAVVIYIAVAGYIGTCALISTWVGARERMAVAPPPAPVSAVDPAARRECMQQLEALQAELNQQLDETLARLPARRSSVAWEDWSPRWRKQLLDLGARCRLAQGDAPGTAELRDAWLRLARLHRHYTTLAVQFSKEIGPDADGLNQAMDRARDATR